MKERWIGVSDMMSGLMMVFLFVCVSLLVKEQTDNKKIKNKIEEVENKSKKIKSLFNKEFKRDFEKWGLKEPLLDGTIRFDSPKIMFVQGQSKIRRGFREILKDFCPRYINLMIRNFKSEDIHEIRILGHSSSEWKTRSTRERHTSNAKLSFDRAWAVHKFCYDNLKSVKQKQWFSDKAITVGANYVHKIKNSNGQERKGSSRRVEFRVQLKALSNLRGTFYPPKCADDSIASPKKLEFCRKTDISNVKKLSGQSTKAVKNDKMD